MSNQDEFFQGGSSHPAIKCKDVGDVVSGTILEAPVPVEREDLNDASKKVWQLPVNLDVNGEPRTLWVPQSQLSTAIKEAYVAAGAKGLAEGGQLSVKLIEQRPPKRPGWNPQNVFKAKYVPPAAPTVSMDDVFEEEAF